MGEKAGHDFTVLRSYYWLSFWYADPAVLKDPGKAGTELQSPACKASTPYPGAIPQALFNFIRTFQTSIQDYFPF